MAGAEPSSGANCSEDKAKPLTAEDVRWRNDLRGSDEKLKWAQTAEALLIETLQAQPDKIAIVFKLTPRR